MKNIIILPEDAEAAKPHTLIGWVSRKGNFFREESTARYDGATHLKCECGNVTEKPYNSCKECRHKKLTEKYNSYPIAQPSDWNMFYSVSHDRYFNDEEEVLDYCHDEEITPDELLLVNTSPNYLDTFNYSQWDDIMPEDGDGYSFSEELRNAVKAFNEVIKRQPPLSYSPCNERIVFTMKDNL